MIGFIEFIADTVGLSHWHLLVLCFVSFLGSFITAAVGLGGGTLTLATMSLLMPPGVLIPIHGLVQLGSNFGRALLMREYIIRGIIPVFVLGTIIGAFVGGQLVMVLPVAVLQIILSLFILYTVWIPSFTARKTNSIAFLGVGALGAFTTMFVGASGPLIAPFVISASNGRKQIVGTHASLMTIQHTFKLIVFGLMGFGFGPYIPLIICLIFFGFIGTYCGKITLSRLPEGVFKISLKVILTIMAFKLSYDAYFTGF